MPSKWKYRCNHLPTLPTMRSTTWRFIDTTDQQSRFRYHRLFFAMWVDPDLGCYSDDYIGCDVGRSLAYTYNEDALDGSMVWTVPAGTNTYKDRIPMVGTDYFRGPRGPKGFKDKDGTFSWCWGDTILIDPVPGTGDQDTLVELGMTSFIYNNNCAIGSPDPCYLWPWRSRSAIL